jgi:alanine-glyoxylate transaminase/serine-glyoxylate transaminase/serine-pyruvate transaminase
MTSRTSAAKSRLDLLSKHLNHKSPLELNTPFSTERTSHLEDPNGNRIIRNKPQPVSREQPQSQLVNKPKPAAPRNMSTQAAHPALLIPGPIEFDDAVLQSMSHYRYRALLNGIMCA